MASPSELHRYQASFCSSKSSDPEQYGWCGGYVKQCIDQNRIEGKHPDSSTFSLQSASGKSESGLDFDRCLSMAAFFTGNGSPKDYVEDVTTDPSIYTKQIESMRGEIAEKQPWPYTRFTDALDAGLACMPSTPGMSEEKSRCVMKKRFAMVEGLLEMVGEFPKSRTCTRKERRPVFPSRHPYPPRPSKRGRKGGRKKPRGFPHLPSQERYEMVCREWKTTGKDYSAKFLMDFAKGHCIDTCE
jgi:hypothetical protein